MYIIFGFRYDHFLVRRRIHSNFGSPLDSTEDWSTCYRIAGAVEMSLFLVVLRDREYECQFSHSQLDRQVLQGSSHKRHYSE